MKPDKNKRARTTEADVPLTSGLEREIDRMLRSVKSLLIGAGILLGGGVLLILIQANGIVNIQMEDGTPFLYFVGGFLCVMGGLLLWLGLARSAGLAREAARKEERAARIQANGGLSPVLRQADMEVKSRLFLQAKRRVGEATYDIRYRRVRRTNELVIDGWVYDEMTALLEFEHELCAVLDGHTVAAGFDGAHSYIQIDGKTVKEAVRNI